MDDRSRYLICGFVIISAATAFFGYNKLFVERDFIVNNITKCNPQLERCFTWCEGGECEKNYYKKIIKNARNIPVCNGALEQCEPLFCIVGEEGCEITSCSEGVLEDGEACTDPINFQVKEIEPVI
ncbi:MAG: hypothetical protein EXS69_01145 [Candidatus Zambryskibacteria bacterium]|nr:hypothetical protein [Candidatus Zambryskibacteria bacterium]